LDNVRDRIAEQGGELVMGWMVSDDRCRGGNPNENRLALRSLTAHAIWRSSDGSLVEVTTVSQLQKKVGFLVDEELTHPAAQSVAFVDSLDRAKPLMTSVQRAHHSYLISTQNGVIQDLGTQRQQQLLMVGTSGEIQVIRSFRSAPDWSWCK